jgi:hypothetical protein
VLVGRGQDGSPKTLRSNESAMNLPRLTTVGGAYQYLMALLLLLVILSIVLFGAIYFGMFSF